MQPMRSVHFLQLLLLPALLSACEQDAREGFPLDAPLHEPILELRLGSLDDPEQTLSATNQLVIGPEGEMILGQGTEVRVYAEDGALLRRIGREGSGPGEFRQVIRIGLLGDTLWAYDIRERRYSYFGMDGALYRSQNVRWTMGSQSDASPPLAWGLFADGSIFGSPATPSEEIALGRVTEELFLRLDSLGVVVDTIARRSALNEILMVTDAVGPGSRTYFAQPYSNNDLVQIAPNALETVRVDRSPPDEGPMGVLRIVRVGFDNDTVMQRDLTYQVVPLDRSHVDSTLSAMAGRLLAGPAAQRFTAGTLRSGIRDGVYIPAFHPPASNLLIGPDQTIWLHLGSPGHERDWLGLSAEGEPLARVRFPDGFSPLAATADRIWGLQLDELDVPYLVRYRLERAGEVDR
jgi:hypothetical protein